ncbi:zinc finger protein with KRAB and SCAN domains 1-like isoform X1 [Varanus komodoensis]|uniref:zinc finger protein with KRAB and SCAN domains 1-like isoform X1 n=1 Tax=Varanus komodoensis TaxID=61221 RepID=UPI001CF7C808|nr:zinc finger protein with KRAB and SCAN domains 1-like isoform X1 [Varanus komodoensis]
MKERKSTELEEGLEGAGKTTSAVQPDYNVKQPGWGMSQMSKGEPSKGMQQRWEVQWQEFLKTLQSPHSTWGNLPLSETTPWEDTKAFLASFEQVAKACRWPRAEWAARLLPALSGEAEQAFQSLEARDREDYGKVKAAILRGEALRMEMQRQLFRQFCCQEVEDPRRIHSQLQELCRQWLKPERHSKEQILELLILEQFLASLPPDLQGWIRAGGPDSCSQAVALAEDFLMSQQEAEGGKWQGPLPDVCVGSVEAEEVSSEVVQTQIYKEGKQLGQEEICLLESGIKCPSLSSSSLIPEGQEMSGAGPSERLLNLKETGVSLHVVERTLAQPGQQTLFWQVLPEEDGNIQSFGDGKGGQLKVENSQRGRNEAEDASQTMPQISQGNVSVSLTAEMHEERCDEKRCWIKMETSQQGEAVPEETNRVGAETIQRNFPVASEIHELRCDEKRCWIKIKKSQQGEETHRLEAETTQWNFPVTSKMHELRCESKGQPEKTPMERGSEFCELAAGPPGAVGNSSTVPTVGGKSLFSKYERKYHFKSDLVVTHTGESPFKHPMRWEETHTKRCLPKPQGICAGEKQCVLSELGGIFHRRDFIGYQSNHPEEKPYECPEDGNRFKRKQTFLSTHRGRKPHECSVCGKGFTYRAELTRHQRIHTGEKPYECSECGKCFRQRAHLSGHQRIHTGEKPFKCPECGKGFCRRNQLIGHQRTHRTFISSLSSEDGETVDQKVTLTKHHSLYEGY